MRQIMGCELNLKISIVMRVASGLPDLCRLGFLVLPFHSNPRCLVATTKLVSLIVRRGSTTSDMWQQPKDGSCVRSKPGVLALFPTMSLSEIPVHRNFTHRW